MSVFFHKTKQKNIHSSFKRQSRSYKIFIKKRRNVPSSTRNQHEWAYNEGMIRGEKNQIYEIMHGAWFGATDALRHVWRKGESEKYQNKREMQEKAITKNVKMFTFKKLSIFSPSINNSEYWLLFYFVLFHSR